jgi:hypothetical protein
MGEPEPQADKAAIGTRSQMMFFINYCPSMFWQFFHDAIPRLPGSPDISDHAVNPTFNPAVLL